MPGLAHHDTAAVWGLFGHPIQGLGTAQRSCPLYHCGRRTCLMTTWLLSGLAAAGPAVSPPCAATCAAICCPPAADLGLATEASIEGIFSVCTSEGKALCRALLLFHTAALGKAWPCLNSILKGCGSTTTAQHAERPSLPARACRSGCLRGTQSVPLHRAACWGSAGISCAGERPTSPDHRHLPCQQHRGNSLLHTTLHTAPEQRNNQCPLGNMRSVFLVGFVAGVS